jgi:hypothetical protein
LVLVSLPRKLESIWFKFLRRSGWSSAGALSFPRSPQASLAVGGNPGFFPKSAIDFFFVCHSSESWNPVHLNRGSWVFLFSIDFILNTC